MLSPIRSIRSMWPTQSKTNGKFATKRTLLPLTVRGDRPSHRLGSRNWDMPRYEPVCVSGGGHAKETAPGFGCCPADKNL